MNKQIDDYSLSVEFIDLLTTMRLCVAIHRKENTAAGVNRSLVKCCKQLMKRTEAALNRQVLKNIIKAPYPLGQLDAVERQLMIAYEK